MAIRVRWIDKGTDMERIVALCANEVDPRPDDIYLDDAVHGALSDKFEADFSKMGFLNYKIHDKRGD